MEFFSGYEGENDLLALDPRTKLLLFLSGSLVALNFNSMPTICAYAGFLCAVCALSGKRAFAAKAAGVFALLVYLRLEMTYTPLTTGSSAVVGVLMSLVALGMFAFPVAVSFYLIVSTTRISQFLAAFGRMRLPTSVIVPMAVFFRFIPTVQEQWVGVTKAMAFRGISLGPASVIAHPMRTVEYVLVPLLFSSMEVIDELAAAALARGLDGGRERTYYENVRLRVADWIVIAVLAAIVAAALAARFA